jgi:hypothetical protein
MRKTNLLMFATAVTYSISFINSELLQIRCIWRETEKKEHVKSVFRSGMKSNNFERQLAYSVTPQLTFQRWRPERDRGCESAPPGQDYSTTQEKLIDEDEYMAEWWLAKENRRHWGKNLFQCHLIHHESLKKSPGIYPKVRFKKLAP